MRIGIECESIEGKNPIWGIGRIIMKLLEEISRRPELEKNFRFVLYFKDSVPDFEFLKAPVFEKKCVPAPFVRGRLFPIYYFALLPLKLWFEKLDLMFWPNYMLPIIAWGSKNMVVLTEDIWHETHEGKLPFRYRLAYGIFGWWTAKFATKIMAISESSKNEVSKLFKINPERIAVNHLGVNLDKQIANGQWPIAISPKPLAQTKDSNYLLFVGQSFPRRHLKETLEAFEQIAPQFPDIKLVAIGPDKYDTPTVAPLVEKINKNLGRQAITHQNYLTDEELLSHYQSAKGLIYVSDREAFGLPPMEALTYGVPSIVADMPLTHELFGERTFYVRPELVEGQQKITANAIAAQMRELLTNSSKVEQIKKSAPQIVSKYTWSKFTDRWVNIIRRV